MTNALTTITTDISIKARLLADKSPSTRVAYAGDLACTTTHVKQTMAGRRIQIGQDLICALRAKDPLIVRSKPIKVVKEWHT